MAGLWFEMEMQKEEEKRREVEGEEGCESDPMEEDLFELLLPTLRSAKRTFWKIRQNVFLLSQAANKARVKQSLNKRGKIPICQHREPIQSKKFQFYGSSETRTNREMR